MPLKILAIDDSRTMRNMLMIALNRAGFDVTLAEDGIDGLEKLADTSPDVVITDINMPRLDGFGVIDGIRSADGYGQTPILVLTTESAATLKTKAREKGATGWIVKPFDETKLVNAIRKVAV